MKNKKRNKKRKKVSVLSDLIRYFTTNKRNEHNNGSSLRQSQDTRSDSQMSRQIRLTRFSVTTRGAGCDLSIYFIYFHT